MAEENTEGTGMNKWKLAFNLTIVIFLLALGFFLGRKTIKEPETKVVTEYIQGETITDTLYYPQPYKVVVPVDILGIIQQCIKDGIYKELWPERIVTEYIEVNKTDTTAIMLDWSTKRYYTETLFNNDTQGSCTFDAEVQYNRLKMIDYTYSPVVQTVTETKYIIIQGTQADALFLQHSCGQGSDEGNSSVRFGRHLHFPLQEGISAVL